MNMPIKKSKKTERMTKVEAQVVDALKQANPKTSITLRAVKLLTRLTAYHEVGHVAGRMFTGLEASHCVRMTIIPTGDTFGRVTADDCFDETMIESYPPAMIQRIGMQLLIELLAGRGSIARLSGKNRSDSLECIIHNNPDEWEIEGSDVFKSLRVARIMAGQNGDPWKVLMKAAKWTREMFDIPLVWQTVETLVGILLKDGSIEGNEVIMEKCDKIYMLGFLMPDWKKRLMGGNRGVGAIVELGKLKKAVTDLKA
jgi:uncharacterized protein YjhX (UPF0386 family)